MLRRMPRAIGALVVGLVVAVLVSGTALGHERRDVGEYTFDIGFLEEPVYAGTQNGLFVGVHRGEEPVLGASDTIDAEVIYPGFGPRPLPLFPNPARPGEYQSTFVPTAAGNYTFRIFGSIDGFELDESFTSGPMTFDSVQDAGEAQYPVPLPPMALLAQNANRGAEAADLVPYALVLGLGGLLLGLAALALSLANRRRTVSIPDIDDDEDEDEPASKAATPTPTTAAPTATAQSTTIDPPAAAPEPAPPRATEPSISRSTAGEGETP